MIQNSGTVEFLWVMIFHRTFPIFYYSLLIWNPETLFFPGWRTHKACAMSPQGRTSKGSSGGISSGSWGVITQTKAFSLLKECSGGIAGLLITGNTSLAFALASTPAVLRANELPFTKAVYFPAFPPWTLIRLLSITPIAQEEKSLSLHISFT